MFDNNFEINSCETQDKLSLAISVLKLFVDLKSNLALLYNKGHNFWERAELALGRQKNICPTLVSGQYFVFFVALHCSLLEFTALIASRAIKCCKENKITASPNGWRNIPFYLSKKCLLILTTFITLIKMLISAKLFIIKIWQI